MEGKSAELFVDNASVAGAGRALHATEFDESDTTSLGHIVTAALLCDRIILDGSSRLRRMTLDGGETPPLAAIWTWERRYPALRKLSHFRDSFVSSDRWCAPRVLKYLLTAIAKDQVFSERKILDLIPAAYRSSSYFDRELIEHQRDKIEKLLGTKISAEQFLFVTYAWRGLHYHEVAKHLGLVYFPNPQRSIFIERFMVPGDVLAQGDPQAIDFVIKLVTSPRRDLLDKMEDQIKKKYELSVPPFLNYIVQRCKSRDDILSIVNELKASREVADLRCWLEQYDTVLRAGNLIELEKLSREANRSMRSFGKRYGLQRSTMKIFPKLPLGIISVELEEKLEIPLPGILHQEILQKPYLSFLWKVSKAALTDNRPTLKLKSLAPIQQDGDGVEWVYIGNGYELDAESFDQTRFLDFWTSRIHEDELEENVRIRGWSKEETFEKSWRPFGQSDN